MVASLHTRYPLCKVYFVLAQITWLTQFDPRSVRIFLAEGAQLLQELSVPNIIELKFSPRGTYLSTWERPGTPRVCRRGSR